ncbi:hypothetical protein GURASL_34690 [Geotalea uraniireducens]|uniref:Uncharacterized protein n=1 Tax=Geotalea uraniireducens TaxID=351604 RepID=A0ABN6VYX5_9BACT|nr:hypothetical protein [Geotalea uraniireducens]BDV44546.1 hypothetical protein GURASL_34690 [Geotalea uraniireducens]
MPGRTVIAAALLVAVTTGVGHAAATAAPAAPTSPPAQPGNTALPSNLLPTADPAATPPAANPVTTSPPPAAPPRSSGMQHEFHGGFTTIFGVTNGTPRSN